MRKNYIKSLFIVKRINNCLVVYSSNNIEVMAEMMAHKKKDRGGDTL